MNAVIICIKCYKGGHIKLDEMDRVCSTHGQDRERMHTHLCWKSPFGRLWRRWVGYTGAEEKLAIIKH